MNALRQLREAAHVSQADLARHLGVQEPTVEKWESGERPVAARYRFRAVKFLIGCKRSKAPSGTPVKPGTF